MFYRSEQSSYKASPFQAAEASRAYCSLSQITPMHAYTYTMLLLITVTVESLYVSPEGGYRDKSVQARNS